LGSKLSHTRAHLYRAGLEGVAYSINQHVRIFEEDGVPVRRVMAAGGGTKNATWMQIVSDVTGKSISVPAIGIGASYGDAMMAAVGTGCWSGFEELARKVRPGITFEPNMGTTWHTRDSRPSSMSYIRQRRTSCTDFPDDRTFHASHTVIDRRSAMLWTDKMFGTKKPIISMLHLDPLPGDPRYGHGGGTVSTVVEHAKRDLDALQEGGIDGIIVSNEFSLPYQRHMDYVTPATMAYVVGQLIGDLSVPIWCRCDLGWTRLHRACGRLRGKVRSWDVLGRLRRGWRSL